MKHFTAPHEVRERSKLAGMIRALRRGESLPPVLVCGEQAYSGSHRIAAWEKMGIEADYIEMTDDEYREVMEALDLDPMYDSIDNYEDFLTKAQELGLAGDAK